MHSSLWRLIHTLFSCNHTYLRVFLQCVLLNAPLDLRLPQNLYSRHMHEISLFLKDSKFLLLFHCRECLLFVTSLRFWQTWRVITCSKMRSDYQLIFSLTRESVFIPLVRNGSHSVWFYGFQVDPSFHFMHSSPVHLVTCCIISYLDVMWLCQQWHFLVFSLLT